MVEVIEPRNTVNGMADVVDSTESNIVIDVMVRRSQHPRGRRNGHAIHYYFAATHETLFAP